MTDGNAIPREFGEAAVAAIDSAAALSAYISALSSDFRSNPDRWACETIDQYLDSMAAWVADSDFAETDQLPDGRWASVAAVISAAAVYE